MNAPSYPTTVPARTRSSGQAHGSALVENRAESVHVQSGGGSALVDKRTTNGASTWGRKNRKASCLLFLIGNITKWGPQAETYVHQQSGNLDGPELIFISEHHL